jgi:OOP family OmpA-OmpF porin
MYEAPVKAKNLLLIVWLAALLGGLPMAGLAQGPAQGSAQRPGVDAEYQRFMEQLDPANRTRGIRLPAEAGPAASAPGGPPAGQERVVVPLAKPIQPSDAAPTATLTIFFPTGSAMLTLEAMRSIDPLGQALISQTLAPFRFRIEGHTDRVGSRVANQQLSEARAAAVRTYLIQRFGIQSERLVSVGLGEDHPAVETPDEVPERRNRRVMIVNLGT